MIKHIYLCDLCGNDVSSWPKDERPPLRIKFEAMAHLTLRSLESSDASEKIICGKCLTALIAAVRKMES